MNISKVNSNYCTQKTNPNFNGVNRIEAARAVFFATEDMGKIKEELECYLRTKNSFTRNLLERIGLLKPRPQSNTAIYQQPGFMDIIETLRTFFPRKSMSWVAHKFDAELLNPKKNSEDYVEFIVLTGDEHIKYSQLLKNFTEHSNKEKNHIFQSNMELESKKMALLEIEVAMHKKLAEQIALLETQSAKTDISVDFCKQLTDLPEQLV